MRGLRQAPLCDVDCDDCVDTVRVSACASVLLSFVDVRLLCHDCVSMQDRGAAHVHVGHVTVRHSQRGQCAARPRAFVPSVRVFAPHAARRPTSSERSQRSVRRVSGNMKRKQQQKLLEIHRCESNSIILLAPCSMADSHTLRLVRIWHWMNVIQMTHRPAAGRGGRTSWSRRRRRGARRT